MMIVMILMMIMMIDMILMMIMMIDKILDDDRGFASVSNSLVVEV